MRFAPTAVPVEFEDDVASMDRLARKGAIHQRTDLAPTSGQLRTRAEVDAFKAEQGVATTPQVSIDRERIGGSDDLERYLATASR
jgi:glutaredoxin